MKPNAVVVGYFVFVTIVLLLLVSVRELDRRITTLEKCVSTLQELELRQLKSRLGDRP